MATTETIDITPTWSGLLPGLLDVIRNESAPVESIRTVERELTKMARLADAYVAVRKLEVLAAMAADEVP